MPDQTKTVTDANSSDPDLAGANLSDAELDGVTGGCGMPAAPAAAPQPIMKGNHDTQNGLAQALKA
jgi:hypothetical protein